MGYELAGWESSLRALVAESRRRGRKAVAGGRLSPWRVFWWSGERFLSSTFSVLYRAQNGLAMAPIAVHAPRSFNKRIRGSCQIAVEGGPAGNDS